MGTEAATSLFLSDLGCFEEPDLDWRSMAFAGGEEFVAGLADLEFGRIYDMRRTVW